MDVCPTEIILAPAERVWGLLTDPRELAAWTGVTLVDAPARAVRAGDRLICRVGPLRIVFDVVAVQAPRALTFDIALPFGVGNHEQMQITPIDAHACRTTFN